MRFDLKRHGLRKAGRFTGQARGVMQYIMGEAARFRAGKIIRRQQMNFDVITYGVLHRHDRTDNSVVIPVAEPVHEHRKINIAPRVGAPFHLRTENINHAHFTKVRQR